MFVQAFLCALTLATLVVSTPTPVAQAALPTGSLNVQLNTLAKGRGKAYFGSATDNPELTNTTYVRMLDDNTMFGQLTAANSMKWVCLACFSLRDVTLTRALLCRTRRSRRAGSSPSRTGMSSRISLRRTGSFCEVIINSSCLATIYRLTLL